MMISREEFHRRGSFANFKVLETKKEMMSVETLFKEIKADADFRNHNYMFNKTPEELKTLELQEEAVGIKKKFPEIKTEGERFDKIREEMIANTYEPVPIKKDIDYPCIFSVGDGFHRIFLAHQLGYKFIRVKAEYGKYTLEKSICFDDLVDLLNMLVGLFGKDYNKMVDLKEFLEELLKRKPDMAKIYSISYGKFKEYSR